MSWGRTVPAEEEKSRWKPDLCQRESQPDMQTNLVGERKSEVRENSKDREATRSDGKTVSRAGLESRVRSSGLDKLVSLAQGNIQKDEHILSGQLSDFGHKEHTWLITTRIKRWNIFANREGLFHVPPSHHSPQR